MCVAGSENNSLYLYYKGLSKTLLTFKFDTVKSVLDKDKKEDDTNEFVSAVCWRALPDGVSSPPNWDTRSKAKVYHKHHVSPRFHQTLSEASEALITCRKSLVRDVFMWRGKR